MAVKYLLLSSLCLACGLIQLVSGCASLPNREEVLGESASGTDRPELKGLKGRLTAQKSEHILERAAGDVEESEQLKRIVQAEQGITGLPLIAGNRVTLLIDGPETYKAMFDAIEGAKDHIHLETFVLADDEMGLRLADMLLERQAACQADRDYRRQHSSQSLHAASD